VILIAGAVIDAQIVVPRDKTVTDAADRANPY
jgi:hypothetical protein